MAAFEDKLPFYDQRRKLELPPGHARDFMNTPVFSPYLVPLSTDANALALAKSDDMVLPAPADREGYYGERHLEYWLSGFYDASQLMGLELRQTGNSALKHLDFGGCTGRVARHMARDPRYEAWLCDINASYIEWLETHSTSNIKLFQNRPYPTLPFEANSFDLISAFSVFTHISEGELHWLLELRRILRPGGKLYITVLDDASWKFAKDYQWLIQALAHGVEEERLRRDIAGDIPDNRYVLRYSFADAYNCNVFYRRSFLETQWLQHFSAGHFIDQGHFYQSVVILTK